MRQTFLAAALVLAPVAIFAAGYSYVGPSAALQSASLGDMSEFQRIVAETQDIAAGGQLAAAEQRLTDFETAWDEAEPELRQVNVSAWGSIDDAADAALHALRVGTPDAGQVTSTLADLMAALRNPDAGGTAGELQQIAGIAVTDANGRAIPCEEMLSGLRAALDAHRIAEADLPAATELQSKATERCNADDDARADAFSAQALALAAK
jgi:hypothetical protein